MQEIRRSSLTGLVRKPSAPPSQRGHAHVLLGVGGHEDRGDAAAGIEQPPL